MTQHVSHQDNFEDMTRADLRARIAFEIGCRTKSYTQLDTGTLNSLYAFKTGQFHTKTKALNTTRSPGPGGLRYAVAWVYELGVFPRRYPRERPFRRDELEQLARYVAEEPDARPWTEDGVDG